MNPLVSVIIPVYKVEKYLDRCVESVINQTYKNLEIILVDDGSPDNCPAICDTWAEKDARIKVIHKKNGGLSDARNAALDIISGEYLIFVDSDDILALNAVELLMKTALEENSVIVISTKVKKFADEVSVADGFISNQQTVNGTKALETIFCCNTRWEAWGTLYKSNLFAKERFPVGKLYEDIATIPKIVLKAESITFIDSILYYYFERSTSIMRANGRVVKIDLFTIIEENVKLFETIENKEARRNIIAGMLEELLSRVHFAYGNEEKNAEFIKQSKTLAKKHLNKILKADMISAKRKLFMLLVIGGCSRVLFK